MRRELPVRFREGLGVQLPRATRLIMGFTCEGDARRVLDVLPKRFGKYGLTIHPTKTRLVPFRPPSRSQPAATGAASEPGAFDFLGFTHFWGKSRKGTWVVIRHTAASRFVRAITKITQWLRWNRHDPIDEQHQTLWQKLRGHFAYYGITGNSDALRRFRDAVARLWRKWLSRRQSAPPISWADFQGLLKRFPLPPAVVVHSVYRVAAKP
jgi:RNA-directed DNA polymerase